MKKVWMILLMILLLSGCAASQTFETVGDVYAPQEIAQPANMIFSMPEDAASQVMVGENGRLYFCDGYEAAVQTIPAGDLNRTIQQMTGYQQEELTVIETTIDNITRYECVWTSAGEAGDYVGRCVILDDGSYHYCLSVMAQAQEAGSLQQSWQSMLQSVKLRD